MVSIGELVPLGLRRKLVEAKGYSLEVFDKNKIKKRWH